VAATMTVEPVALSVPELGPSLGRLTAPATGGESWWADLDPVRYQLVTDIFELAGRARAAGDPHKRMAALDPEGWIAAWDRAVAACAERLVKAIDTKLLAAAAEARMPRRRKRVVTLAPAEARAILVRLGAGAGPFLTSLDAIKQERSAAEASNASDPAGYEAWERALTTAARRLEAAWLALEDTVRREQAGWTPEVERVRSWRRPWWPVIAVEALLLGAAVYLGLVIGGYLAAPEWLQPLVAWWWEFF